MAGQNAAYDQFPCQYQIFYRGKAKSSMWYDPVFQVSTIAQSPCLTEEDAEHSACANDEGRAHKESKCSRLDLNLCAVSACAVGVVRYNPAEPNIWLAIV